MSNGWMVQGNLKSGGSKRKIYRVQSSWFSCRATPPTLFTRARRVRLYLCAARAGGEQFSVSPTRTLLGTAEGCLGVRVAGDRASRQQGRAKEVVVLTCVFCVFPAHLIAATRLHESTAGRVGPVALRRGSLQIEK